MFQEKSPILKHSLLKNNGNLQMFPQILSFGEDHCETGWNKNTELLAIQLPNQSGHI